MIWPDFSGFVLNISYQYFNCTCTVAAHPDNCCILYLTLHH